MDNTVSLRLHVLNVKEFKGDEHGYELSCLKQTNLQSQEGLQNFNGTPIDSQDEVRVDVQGVWSQNRIKKNSTIHLINPIFNKETNHYIVDNKNGLLVIEPDNLYTCTLIASSLFCERKTWLNHVFLGLPGSNKAMTIGTLTHEVFQYALRNRIVDTAKLIKFLDEQLDDATVMLQIYSAETTLKEVRDEAIKYIPSIREWIEKYMFTGPPVGLDNDPNYEVKVTKVVDIEENVWSTKYGLKGKIDVTGLVKVHDRKNKTVEEKIIPLELKTGNPNLSSSHAAQVSLYSMMIEDRYAITNQGFVIYLKDKAAMHNVGLTNNTKRDLVQRRNVINYHMKDYSYGPDMLNQARVCTNCERLQECVLMSNIYKPTMLEESPVLKSLEKDAIGHLDPQFIAFFKRYHEKLVRLMTKSGNQPISDVNVPNVASFWTRSSEESEQAGMGFGKLQATKSTKDDSKYIIFKRHPDRHDNYIEIETPKIVAALFGSSANSAGSHPETKQTTKAPMITISDVDSQPKTKKCKITHYFGSASKRQEQQLLKSTNGRHDSDIEILEDGKGEEKVTSVDGQSTALQLSQSNTKPFVKTTPMKKRRKLKPFDADIFGSLRSRYAISLDHDIQSMDLLNSSTALAIGFIDDIKQDYISMKLYEGNIDVKRSELMYRVDKLEKRSNFDIERVVLIRLLENSDHCDRIRKLLTDPEYKTMEDLRLDSHIVHHCNKQIDNYDVVEQKFIVRAISTQNYYVLDEKIAPNRFKVLQLIGECVGIIRNTLDKTIIIVARHIDSMIDLMKLLRKRKLAFNLVDDGSSTKARYEFSAELIRVSQLTSIPLEKKFDVYVKAHEIAKIVFTTYPMAIGGLQFSRRRFDYCIEYDCEKVELFLGLAPMFISDKHILIDYVDEPNADSEQQAPTINEDDITLGRHLRSRRQQQCL